MSIIFCDSNCELWFDKAEALGLQVIKMPYTIEGVQYDYDLGKNTDFKKFYDMIRHGSMPITSALNPQNYVNYFEPFLKSGQDILYITFSHKLSGTFEFMKTAIAELKEKYPERTINYVDTQSVSVGAGLIVYEAALLKQKGATDSEIIEFVNSFKQNVAAYFFVESLQHLKRGGRISPMAAMIGGMLQVKPLLAIDTEGKLVSVDKISGRKKAINELFERLKALGQNVADHPICIMHADSLSDAEFLAEKVRAFAPEANIWIQPIGPTVGTHCGPETLAIVFHASKRI